MKIIKNIIKISYLEEMSKKMYGDLVKAVVDIKREIMAIDGEMHADEEALLIEKGSSQKDLWGINLYPELKNSKNFIEFDSIINLRPSQGNRTRGADDLSIQKKVREIINKLVK